MKGRKNYAVFSSLSPPIPHPLPAPFDSPHFLLFLGSFNMALSRAKTFARPKKTHALQALYLIFFFFFYDGYCNVSVGYICRCFGGYDGPNCELTTRSFEPGEWIWLPPPQQCTVGSLSLEFASREANGLLLYGGPTSPVGSGDVYDFITVELSGGKILVCMSLGDRDDVVRLGVTSGMALNDGEWHHIEVFRDKTVNTFLLFLLFFGGVYLAFYLDSAVFVTQSLVKATK